MHDVDHLIGDRFERRSDKVRPARAARNAADYAARVRVPMRRAEPGERRDDIDSARVGDAERDLLGLRGRLDHLELVAKPLYHRSAYKHAALENILRLLPVADCGERRDQAAL